MKACIKILFTICLMLASVVSVVHAEHPEVPADNSSAELKRIKELAGRWTSTTSMFGKENEKVYTEYTVTSGGSAVLERIFPGTPQEMVSVYYDDEKGKLTMTHYCIMRTRSVFKMTANTVDSITLDVAKIEGLKSKNDPSMGEISLQFIDKDHIATTCNGGEKGKEKPMRMDYTRVKK